MSNRKNKDAKTDLQRRYLIGGSLAFAGTAASGALTGCGGGASAVTQAPAGGATPLAAAPAFAPAAGTYSNPLNVTISSATSGASIYYTADGTTPTMSSTVYAGPIPVSSGSKTVRAMAAASGYQPSSVATAAYTIATTPLVATPTFTPVAGSYSSVQTVTLACATAGATIYYTTDGSTPTTSSSKYSIPLTINLTQTVKAIATAAGDTQSAVGTAAYTISAAPGVATPTFTPVAGNYTSVQTVTIACATSGAIIYFTTDGSLPTTSSAQYSAPLTVSSTETVQAIAAAGGKVSAVGTASYSIGGGALTAPANLQMINQGGPNNGPQGFYSYLGSTVSVALKADADYQGFSWLAATPGTNPVASYRIYRNGTLYDTVATPITFTGYISGQVLIVTAGSVSGGKTNIADGKILPGLKLTSSAGGFAAGTVIVEYTTANTGGGGAGTYSVNFSQTCGSAASPVTFTGWSYNDTAATGCNHYDFTGPGTVYEYAVCAVDTQNNEGPKAYPAVYQYQGISQCQKAQFSYGGIVQNFTDTAGSPVDGPYDVALTFPSGGGGFLAVWAGAGPDTNGCLCPVQHFECGAFNYFTFDIKVMDNLFETMTLQYIPVLRGYGVVGGADNAHWRSVRVQDYCTPIVGEWVRCKIPFSALPYGFAHVHGSFQATAPNYGIFTVDSFDSMTFFGVDGAGYVTGPGVPPNTYTNNGPGWTDPKAPYTGTGPWQFHVGGPNIVGTESGSGTYVIQQTGCYKHGWQYAGNFAANAGAFYLNNIGFTTD